MKLCRRIDAPDGLALYTVYPSIEGYSTVKVCTLWDNDQKCAYLSLYGVNTDNTIGTLLIHRPIEPNDIIKMLGYKQLWEE